MKRLTSVLSRRLVLSAAALVLLGGLTVVPVATSGLMCPDLKVGLARSPAEEPTSRGIDLELRILHVRIEFPWMKSLPVTPARHVVISWMANTED